MEGLDSCSRTGETCLHSWHAQHNAHAFAHTRSIISQLGTLTVQPQCLCSTRMPCECLVLKWLVCASNMLAHSSH